MAVILTDQFGAQYALSVDATDNESLSLKPVNPSPVRDNSLSISAWDLIRSALRLIGVLAAGEQLDLATANDSLMVLAHMMDGWNADHLAIFTTRGDDYPLTAGKQAYTLGIGGDWVANRPARIASASVILLSNPSNPVEYPIPVFSEAEEWQKIPVKAVSGSFPLCCYDDGGFPLRTLSMWPIPMGPHNLRIYSDQSLDIPPTVQTVLSFPPGYLEAFRYNLACRLAAEFDESLTPIVQQTAIESLARVRSLNAPLLTLRSDLAGGGRNLRAELFGLP